MTDSAIDTECRKFPGKWEWLGMACEADAVVVAHVAGGEARPRVLQIWHARVNAGGGPINPQLARIRAFRAAMGGKIARKVPCSIVLENADYEVLTPDEPDLKDVDDFQKMQALRWTLQPLVNFSVEHASIDVLIPSAVGRRQVMAVVAPESAISPWMRAGFDEGIKLSAIDVPETAQRNLAHLAESGTRALAMLVLSEGKALLTLSAAGQLLMTRQIEIGDVQQLANDSRMRDRLSLEVQRTLDNFERQSGRSGAVQMLVAPAALASAITEHLAVALGFPVESLTPALLMKMLDVASQVQVGASEWGHLDLLAIGAACRGANP